jgi:hypothetical protein
MIPVLFRSGPIDPAAVNGPLSVAASEIPSFFRSKKAVRHGFFGRRVASGTAPAEPCWKRLQAGYRRL